MRALAAVDCGEMTQTLKFDDVGLSEENIAMVLKLWGLTLGRAGGDKVCFCEVESSPPFARKSELFLYRSNPFGHLGPILVKYGLMRHKSKYLV